MWAPSSTCRLLYGVRSMEYFTEYEARDSEQWIIYRAGGVSEQEVSSIYDSQRSIHAYFTIRTFQPR